MIPSMRTARLARLVTALSLLAGCAANERLMPLAPAPAQSPPATPAADSLDSDLLGQQLYDHVIASYGPELASIPLTDYLVSLAESVAQGLELEGMPARTWRIAVVDSPEKLHFSTSAGHLLLWRGLLQDELANEAQLAAVLAHEMAHVSHHDLVDRIRMAVEEAEGQTREMRGGSVVRPFSPPEVLRVAESVIFRDDDAGRTRIAFQFTRAQELDAASLAIRVLQRLHYDSLEVVGMLRSLQSQLPVHPEAAVHRANSALISELERLALQLDRGRVGRETYRSHVLDVLSQPSPGRP